MPILNRGSSAIYYELHGAGEPVVLVAGLSGSHTYWVPVLELFAAHYQVLIFDNRGTGQTIDTAASLTIDLMVDDVMSLVEAVDFKKPHIVGHSLGGAVGQVIAKKFPAKISSLVLCNTRMNFPQSNEGIFAEIVALYQQKKSPAEIMEKLAPHIFSKKFLTPQMLQVILEMVKSNPYPQTYQGYERQLQSLYTFDSSAWIDEITVPTLVIGSAEDTITPLIESEKIAAAIPRAKCVVTETGHASFVEDPAFFYETLNQFFADLR